MKDYAGAFLKNNKGLVFLDDSQNHPLIMRYGEIFEAAIINVDINHGRYNPGFLINKHHFFNAVLKMKRENASDLYRLCRAEIKGFYSSFTPKNVNEWFGLKLKNESLGNSPPWFGVLPWRARSPESYAIAIEKGAIKDNSRYGLEKGIVGGWTFCGPVVDEKIDLEAMRFVEVFNSVVENGYLRSDDADGDIKCTALINSDNDWRWMVTSGYHRAAVLAGLGYKKIPVRVNLVVKLDESSFWPHVMDGTYKEEEAKFIFNKIFNGELTI